MGTFKITTDDTLMEMIQHGNGSYPFAYYLEDIWQFDFHRIDWHWHHELEFVSVAEGVAICLVGTERIELPAGCGIFINSGILHRFEAKDHAIIPNIVFSPALLAPEKSLVYEQYIHPVIRSSLAYQVFDPQIVWQGHVLQILSQIYTLQETEGKNELHTMQLLLQIWDLLYRHLDTASRFAQARQLNHQQARLQLMMQYIHDHYREGILLEEIAASASVSVSGALQIFKSFIHASPVAYLIQYRLAQAAKQLHTTGKTVAAIAEETGFTNAGYFCRKFRQHYHMSPNEYRKKGDSAGSVHTAR